MKARTLTLSLSLALNLAACGGGGGGSTQAPAAGSTDSTSATGSGNSDSTAPTVHAAGLWAGTTSGGGTTKTVILDDGSFYVFYSAAADKTALGGVVQGDTSLLGTGVASSNAIDFNWEGFGGTRATVSGSFDTLRNLNASVTNDATPSRNFSFTAAYQSGSASVVNLADLAGTFANTDRSMAINISATGVISGFAFASNCQVTGTVTPTSNYTTVMNLSLTFLGGTCSYGTSTISGVALYNQANKELAGVALDSARSSAALFQARKP